MIGTVVGALGGAGLAVAYNHKKGIEGTIVTWSDEAIQNFYVEATLLYLAVSHFGRGRGNWIESEHPSHWLKITKATIDKNIISHHPQSSIIDSTIRSILSHLYKNSNF